MPKLKRFTVRSFMNNMKQTASSRFRKRRDNSKTIHKYYSVPVPAAAINNRTHYDIVINFYRY